LTLALPAVIMSSSAPSAAPVLAGGPNCKDSRLMAPMIVD
jgi:hypothetical protein